MFSFMLLILLTSFYSFKFHRNQDSLGFFSSKNEVRNAHHVQKCTKPMAYIDVDDKDIN
jgi:hypothetical protein